MIEIIILVSITVDFTSVVQFAVENAVAIKDLATAVYMLSKASKNLRK